MDANEEGIGFNIFRVGANEVGSIKKTSDNKNIVISGHIKKISTFINSSNWNNNIYTIYDADITTTSL